MKFKIGKPLHCLASGMVPVYGMGVEQRTVRMLIRAEPLVTCIRKEITMKNVVLVLLSLFVCSLSSAADPAINLSLNDTQVGVKAISTLVSTKSMDMEATRPTNQLALTIEVTPGTSLKLRVTCSESSDSSKWHPIALCDSAQPTSTCAPDTREFTFADYPTVSGKKYILTRWSVRERFVKCGFVDPAGGSGTITVLGARSWQ